MLASLRSYHSMLRRQKPRIEAPADRLGDYEHKHSALLSEHEDLMSRCAALKDAHKSLQLEKQDWKQTRRTALREEGPCANLAAQARPRAGASTESMRRSIALEDVRASSNRTSITDMQASQEPPPSPSGYTGPRKSAQRPELSPEASSGPRCRLFQQLQWRRR